MISVGFDPLPICAVLEERLGPLGKRGPKWTAS